MPPSRPSPAVAPPDAGDILLRPRLLERLDVPHPLAVVHAPPGYGKSALVASWHDHRAGRMRVVSPDLLGEALAPDSEVDVVVVDGYAGEEHAPDEASAIVAALTRPGAPRLVVASRTKPSVVTSAWEFGLDVTVLSGRDLLPTREELVAITSLWGHSLDDQQIDVLMARTGGWLRPTRLLLDDQSASGEHSPVATYLRSTVLGDLDDRLLACVTALSVAGEITTAHRRTLGSRPDATTDDLADRLHEIGVLQDRTGAHAVPPVVSDAVRSVVDPDMSRRWHQAFASELRCGSDESGVSALLRHAFAAGDWKTLESLWTARGVRLLEIAPDAAVGTYAEVPTTELRDHPALTIPRTAARAIREDRPFREIHHLLWASLRPLSAWFDGVQMDHAGDLDTYLYAAACHVAMLRVTGRWPEARTTAFGVHRRYTEECGQRPDSLRYAWFLMQWGFTEHAAGHVEEAKRLLRRAFLVAHEVPDARLVQSTCAVALHAISALEGKAADADHWGAAYDATATAGVWVDGYNASAAHLVGAQRAIDRLDRPDADRHLANVADPRNDPEFWPHTAFARASYALAYGNPAETLDELDLIGDTYRAQIDAGGLGSQLLRRLRADLLVACGELNRAVRVAQDEAGTDGSPPAPALARAELIGGAPGRARRLADAARWEKAVTPRDRLDWILISAAASVRLGETTRAEAAFDEAVELARAMGALQPLAAVPQDARPLLFRRMASAFTAEEIARLEATDETYPRSARLVRLSEREHLVLTHLARSLTLNEIARELTVSTNTVKKQAMAVYGKLGVHDRESVVLQALRLGLLGDSSLDLATSTRTST